eukprot:m.168497 g.168497  ORF g.168497 m.168497 type:complete len:361 (+) comp38956_c0_seq25:303-1385(+)
MSSQISHDEPIDYPGNVPSVQNRFLTSLSNFEVKHVQRNDYDYGEPMDIEDELLPFLPSPPKEHYLQNLTPGPTTGYPQQQNPTMSCEQTLQNAVIGGQLISGFLELQYLDVPLSDIHINKGQQLLKRQFPLVHGFQDTKKVINRGTFDQVKPFFVQILHVNDNHWITVSDIFCQKGEVAIYDSLCLMPGDECLRHIAFFLSTLPQEITVHLMNVQLQENTSMDCGVFALAFATALCNGTDPTLMHFRRSQMRGHLKTCFEKESLLEFPFVNLKRERLKKLIPLLFFSRQKVVFRRARVLSTIAKRKSTCFIRRRLSKIAVISFPLRFKLVRPVSFKQKILKTVTVNTDGVNIYRDIVKR